MNLDPPAAPASAPSRPTSGGQLAAIDIGSNSFRLEIARVDGDRYRRIDYLKETVRLGAGLDADGLLTDEAGARGLACLARFARRLDGFAAVDVRAVATQTLREARNRDAFLRGAEAVLGHPIEVISGREEARLIYAGVARLQPSTLPRLVIDIGGRSTEMILGQGRRPLRAESFGIGSVSLSMRYFADGRFTEAGFREAQIAAGAEFEEALGPFAPAHWQEALGSSGTAGAVSQLLLANRITDGRITPEALRWLIERCLEAAHVDRLALPGLKDDRRAVIGGGLAILYTLAAHFDIAALQPARGALRQGVIFDLDERRGAATSPDGPHDLRDASVVELQQSFGADSAQAARVAAVAGALQVALQPEADGEARRELLWAAALHEIGMMISHHDHHRHSAYVLDHVDAPGFSQSQLRRLGALVRGQRGGLRKVEEALAGEDFAWQLLCLRLAVVVCHARGDAPADAVRATRDGTTMTLALGARSREASARTRYLLTQEAALWERHGPLRLKLAG